MKSHIILALRGRIGDCIKILLLHYFEQKIKTALICENFQHENQIISDVLSL